MASRPTGEMADLILRLAESRGAKSLTIKVPDVPGSAAAEAEAIKPKGETMEKKSPRARYTKPGDDGMNKTERRYAEHLESLRLAGEIYRWDFEAEKFRLANIGHACYLTLDFRVLLNDGTVEFHDVKGFMEPDAQIKLKWFVQAHPYPLVIVRWKKGKWEYERMTG